MARPCKLTPALQDEICKFLRAGSFRETAAAAVGIHKNTLKSWLRKAAADRAADKETKYTVFADATDKAEAEAEIRDVAKIEQIGRDGDWRALAWVLERRGAKRWGFRNADQMQQGSEPVAVTIEYTRPNSVTDDDDPLPV